MSKIQYIYVFKHWTEKCRSWTSAKQAFSRSDVRLRIVNRTIPLHSEKCTLHQHRSRYKSRDNNRPFHKCSPDTINKTHNKNIYLTLSSWSPHSLGMVYNRYTHKLWVTSSLAWCLASFSWSTECSSHIWKDRYTGQRWKKAANEWKFGATAQIRYCKWSCFSTTNTTARGRHYNSQTRVMPDSESPTGLRQNQEGDK